MCKITSQELPLRPPPHSFLDQYGPGHRSGTRQLSIRARDEAGADLKFVTLIHCHLFAKTTVRSALGKNLVTTTA